jgi:hypothetical protein
MDDPSTSRRGTASSATGSTFPMACMTFTLHFAEINYKAQGRRIFDVRIEGILVRDNYDIQQLPGTMSR